MKKLTLAFSTFLLFTIFAVFRATPLCAFLISDIDDVEGRVYTLNLNLETGQTTVIFGDGMPGATLPSGEENIIATYRYGAGTMGNILNTYNISTDFSPFLIPIDAFSTDEGRTEYNLILSGITTLEFEISNSGVLITKVEFSSSQVPEPSTLLIFGSGIAGLVALRKKFKN